MKKRMFVAIACMAIFCALLAGCQSGSSQSSSESYVGTWDVVSATIDNGYDTDAATDSGPSEAAESEPATVEDEADSSETASTDAAATDGSESADSATDAAAEPAGDATTPEGEEGEGSPSGVDPAEGVEPTPEPGTENGTYPAPEPTAVDADATSTDESTASQADATTEDGTAPAPESGSDESSASESSESADASAASSDGSAATTSESAESSEAASENSAASTAEGADSGEATSEASDEQLPEMSPMPDGSVIEEPAAGDNTTRREQEEAEAAAQEEQEPSYMRFYDDGTAAFYDDGFTQTGTWEIVDGQAHAELGGMQYELKFEGSQLVATSMDMVYRMEKGEDKDPFEVLDEEMSMADENGLSILMDEGQKLGEEITLADDDVCSIVADGIGVAPTGDPGYNLQISNKSTETIIVSTPDFFQVDGKDVMVYLYTTLDPHRSTTSFLQFDTDDIESNSTDALKNIEGTIHVTTLEGEDRASYDITLGTE